MKRLRINGKFASYNDVTKSGGKWRLPNGQFASKEVTEAAKSFQRRERARRAPRDERGKFLPKAEQQAVIRPVDDIERNRKLLEKKKSKYWIIHISLMVTKKEGKNYVNYFNARKWKTNLRKFDIKQKYEEMLEKARDLDTREDWSNYDRIADLFQRSQAEGNTGGYLFSALLTIRNEESIPEIISQLPDIIHSQGVIEVEAYG